MSMNSFHARQKHPAAVPKNMRLPKEDALPRVDMLLVQQGLADSRAEAQRLISAGLILYEGEIVSKPARKFPANARFTRTDSFEYRYVSRGGLKLAGALAKSRLSVTRRVCLDIGQSTGGFTDCLLQAGAARVVGVDVGHGQLHQSLKTDSRIVSFEGINARTLSPADLNSAMPDNGFDLIAADVSFISLTLIIPRLPALLHADGNMLLLVKPQFEVGPGGIGKGGIVKSPSLYDAVARKLRECALASRLRVLDWFDSPIAGGDGNREFFIWTSHEH